MICQQIDKQCIHKMIVVHYWSHDSWHTCTPNLATTLPRIGRQGLYSLVEVTRVLFHLTWPHLKSIIKFCSSILVSNHRDGTCLVVATISKFLCGYMTQRFGNSHGCKYLCILAYVHAHYTLTRIYFHTQCQTNENKNM